MALKTISCLIAMYVMERRVTLSGEVPASQFLNAKARSSWNSSARGRPVSGDQNAENAQVSPSVRRGFNCASPLERARLCCAPSRPGREGQQQRLMRAKKKTCQMAAGAAGKKQRRQRGGTARSRVQEALGRISTCALVCALVWAEFAASTRAPFLAAGQSRAVLRAAQPAHPLWRRRRVARRGAPRQTAAGFLGEARVGQRSRRTETREVVA